jgi:hypothetical protein
MPHKYHVKLSMSFILLLAVSGCPSSIDTLSLDSGKLAAPAW